MYSLSKYAAMTGDEEALEMAGKMCRYIMKPKFWGGVALSPEEVKAAGGPNSDNGIIVGELDHFAAAPSPKGIPAAEKGHFFNHHTCNAMALRGILEYGMATSDQHCLDFVRNSYAYVRSHLVMDATGWTCHSPTRMDTNEGCSIGMNISLAIRLTDAGLGDFWDDVDTLVRNQLVEQQISESGAELAREKAQFHTEYPDFTGWPFIPRFDEQVPGQQLTEGVFERLPGLYWGMAGPTSCAMDYMGCCTGQATAGWYYAWEGAVREQLGLTQVNLLINRNAPSLEVMSHLPYSGRVQILNKTAESITVRIPRWVQRNQLRVQVGDQDRSLIWVGNYILVSDLKPGEVVTLTFPIREWTQQHTHRPGLPGETVLTFHMRGGVCTHITPFEDHPGVFPLYQRKHLINDVTPMQEIAARGINPVSPILNW